MTRDCSSQKVQKDSNYSKDEIMNTKVNTKASFDELQVGQAAVYDRVVENGDIQLFAELSGDNNPVHLNDQFAMTTMFKGRIAHGMLSATFISKVLGTQLPGEGAIYVEQSLRFKAPVRPGDGVRTTVTVTELVPEKRRVRLDTVCAVDGKVVIEGNATLFVPAP